MWLLDCCTLMRKYAVLLIAERRTCVFQYCDVSLKVPSHCVGMCPGICFWTYPGTNPETFIHHVVQCNRSHWQHVRGQVVERLGICRQECACTFLSTYPGTFLSSEMFLAMLLNGTVLYCDVSAWTKRQWRAGHAVVEKCPGTCPRTYPGTCPPCEGTIMPPSLPPKIWGPTQPLLSHE